MSKSYIGILNAKEPLSRLELGIFNYETKFEKWAQFSLIIIDIYFKLFKKIKLLYQ
jgi:hypothetical protein